MNLKLVAAARTFLFNFGRGDVSPFGIYRDLCAVLDVDKKLSPLPEYKFLSLPFSFFTKEPTRRFYTPAPMVLFDFGEDRKFVAQPTAVKLNWLRNFSYMQELLCNFSEDELFEIEHLLQTWPRPNYEPYKLPFASASSVSSSKSLLQQPQ